MIIIGGGQKNGYKTLVVIYQYGTGSTHGWNNISLDQQIMEYDESDGLPAGWKASATPYSYYSSNRAGFIWDNIWNWEPGTPEKNGEAWKANIVGLGNLLAENLSSFLENNS